MKANNAIALLVIAILGVTALAHDNTADDWTNGDREQFRKAPLESEISAYDNILEGDPGNISAHLGIAQALMILGRKNESLAVLQDAIDLTNNTLKERPEDADAWQARGVALAGLGRDEAALESLKKSAQILNKRIANDPGDADTWWLLAESYEAMGMPDAAIRAYDNITRLNSTKAVGAWIRVADINSVKAKGYDESVRAFNRAAELMPGNASWAGGSVFDQGIYTLHMDIWSDGDRILRVSIGSYNRSSEEYEFISQAVSKPVSTWLIRGNGIDTLRMRAPTIVNGEIVQRDTAESWLKRGDDLRSTFVIESAMMNNTTLQPDYKNVSTWLKKNEDALKAYERVLKITNNTLNINPRDSSAWRDRGAALASLGYGVEANESYHKAVEIYNQSIESDQENVSAWWHKAEVLRILGRSDAALQAYDRVRDLNSSMAFGALIRRSDIFFSRKEYNESAQAFERAVEVLSEDSGRIASESGLNTSDDNFLSTSGGIYAGGPYVRDITAFQRTNHTGIHEIGWRERNINLRINTGFYKGQILRVSFYRYNETGKYYDYYLQIDSGFVDRWQDKSSTTASRMIAYQRALEAMLRNSKGQALHAPGRGSEAEETRDRAKDLGHKE